MVQAIWIKGSGAKGVWLGGFRARVYAKSCTFPRIPKLLVHQASANSATSQNEK